MSLYCNLKLTLYYTTIHMRTPWQGWQRGRFVDYVFVGSNPRVGSKKSDLTRKFNPY